MKIAGMAINTHRYNDSENEQPETLNFVFPKQF